MKAKSNSTIDFEVYLTLTEQEARALKGLTVYGADTFLKVFYEYLGKTYLQPHEKGLQSLFDSIDKEIPKHLNRLDKARKVFQEGNPNK